MKKYLFAFVALVAVACTPEKKIETPESIINTEWFRFVEVGNVDNSRTAKETLLFFYVKGFRMTNRNINTSPSGKQDITYDTIYGSSYTYKRPVGTMVFEREIYNPCTLMAGPSTLKLEFTNDTLVFFRN